MTQKEFEHRITAAETFKRLTDDPLGADFWAGYIRGVVRRHYLGANFGTDDEHPAWMNAVAGDNVTRHMDRLGYTAGFSGLDIVIEYNIIIKKLILRVKPFTTM